jgi:hypothetical protein
VAKRSRKSPARPGQTSRPTGAPPGPTGQQMPASGPQQHPPPGQALEPRNPELAESVKERPEFWNGILRAAGTEPRTAKEIGGATGVRHGAIAIGVDDVERRLIIISAESDARSASLAQADIQSATPDYRVIVARPLIVSAGQVASAFAQATGTSRMSLGALATTIPGASQEEIQKVMEGYFREPFAVVDQWIRTARSVSSLSLSQGIKQLIDQFSGIRVVEANEEDLTIDLSSLTGSPATSLDSQLGICGLPLYEMSDSDLDAFVDPHGLDAARDVLRRHNVLQFFFPAPDQLLLGSIDRGAAITAADEPATLAARLGHPTGEMELVPGDTPLTDLIDALQDRKLLVEGEVSVELTEEGRAQRASVKFSAREGIVSKIVNRISVSIDLKNIVGLNFGRTDSPKEEPRSGASES